MEIEKRPLPSKLQEFTSILVPILKSGSSLFRASTSNPTKTIETLIPVDINLWLSMSLVCQDGAVSTPDVVTVQITIESFVSVTFLSNI